MASRASDLSLRGPVQLISSFYSETLSEQLCMIHIKLFIFVLHCPLSSFCVWKTQAWFLLIGQRQGAYWEEGLRMCAVHFLLKNEVLRRRGLRHVAFGFKMTWKKQNRSPLTSQKKEKSLRHRVEYDYNMSNFQLLSINYCRTLRRKRCKRSLKGTFRRNPQQHSMKRSQRGALCMNVSDFKKTFDVLMTFSRLPGVFSVSCWHLI